MGGALFYRPLLHSFGNFIGGGDIQRGSIGDALLPGAVGRGREPLLHGLLIENQAPEELGEFLGVAHARYPPYRLIWYPIIKSQERNR